MFNAFKGLTNLLSAEEKAEIAALLLAQIPLKPIVDKLPSAARAEIVAAAAIISSEDSAAAK